MSKFSKQFESDDTFGINFALEDDSDRSLRYLEMPMHQIDGKRIIAALFRVVSPSESSEAQE